jgi:Family of unknown function (DUF6148)
MNLCAETSNQAKLDAYLAAETAVLSGQKYEIEGRLLQRANLGEIQTGIDIWNRRVQRLSARASGRAIAITPRPKF